MPIKTEDLIPHLLLSPPQRVFEAPPSSQALFDYIDNFPSRNQEKEKERKNPPACSKDMGQPVVENPLLR